MTTNLEPSASRRNSFDPPALALEYGTREVRPYAQHRSDSRCTPLTSWSEMTDGKEGAVRAREGGPQWLGHSAVQRYRVTASGKGRMSSRTPAAETQPPGTARVRRSDPEVHVDEVGAVVAAVDHQRRRRHASSFAGTVIVWLTACKGALPVFALNPRDRDRDGRGTGVREADLEPVTQIVLACAGLLAAEAPNVAVRHWEAPAAIAGAALATTTAGTAHAVPFTTVRREMPDLGFVISDLSVTCTPMVERALARNSTFDDAALRQLPPGLPEPYRYRAVIWLHFGHGG